MRSKHGRGRIKYKWKAINSAQNEIEQKTVEYDYDQKANWQRSIFLTEGDRVRLFFRTIDDHNAMLGYVALIDVVYQKRRYGTCYFDTERNDYFIDNRYGDAIIQFMSFHVVDKKVQAFNLEDKLIVFEFKDIPLKLQTPDLKVATRCRWVQMDEEYTIKG